jgi:hypothetical protein
VRNGRAENYNDKVLVDLQMAQEQGNDIIMTDVFQHMLLNMGVVNNELLRQLRGTLKALAGLFPIGILVDSGGDFATQFLQYERLARKFAPNIPTKYMPWRWPLLVDVDLSNQSKPRKQWGKKKKPEKKTDRAKQVPKMSGFRGKSLASSSPLSLVNIQLPDMNTNRSTPLINPPKRRRLMKGPGYVHLREDGTWGS